MIESFLSIDRSLRLYLVTGITNLGIINKLHQELKLSKELFRGNRTIAYQYNKQDKIVKGTKTLHFSHETSRNPTVMAMINQLSSITNGICELHPPQKSENRHKRQILATAAATIIAYTTVNSLLGAIFDPQKNNPQQLHLRSHDIPLKHINQSIERFKNGHNFHNPLFETTFALFKMSMALDLITTALQDVIKPNH